MRLLILHHPAAATPRIEAAARASGAMNLSALPTREANGTITLLSLPNRGVEGFIEAIEDVPELGVVLIPHEVMSVPPDEEPDSHVESAGMRSPLEVYLDSLSSIGGWTSYLVFAALAGLLAWSGFYNETIILLIAAMLIAPYPSPVLNTAIATARGSGRLLLRSLGRYTLAIGIGVGVAFGLSALYGVDAAGTLAESWARLSDATLLLPLAAGVVGGLYLIESEESSLVTATGAGLLVTAALSPPVGILGMALWTGEGTLAARALYVIFLQLAGINLTAAATFRLAGLGTAGPWYHRGRRWVSAAGAAGTVLVLSVLLWWQFSTPDLRRGSVARDAVAVVRAQLDSIPDVRWIAGRAEVYGDGAEAVLLTTVQARWTGDPEARESARSRLSALLAGRIRDRLPRPEGADGAAGIPATVVDLTLLE